MKLNKNINQVINNYFNWCSLIRYEFNKKKKINHDSFIELRNCAT